MEVLSANLVKPRISDKVFFETYTDVTPQNLVKLCLRGKQLYEARVEATQICKLTTEIEQTMKPRSLVWCLLQDDSPDLSEAHRSVLQNLIQLLSKALSVITVFQTEHNNFKKEFCFNKAHLRKTLCTHGQVVNGYLAKKNEKFNVLQITGLLEEAEDEAGAEERAAFESWLQGSIQLTGKLSIPSD